MIVVAVVCIVEREEANGRPAVEAAAQGAPFLRLFTANEVRAEHIRQHSVFDRVTRALPPWRKYKDAPRMGHPEPYKSSR